MTPAEAIARMVIGKANDIVAKAVANGASSVLEDLDELATEVSVRVQRARRKISKHAHPKKPSVED